MFPIIVPIDPKIMLSCRAFFLVSFPSSLLRKLLIFFLINGNVLWRIALLFIFNYFNKFFRFINSLFLGFRIFI